MHAYYEFIRCRVQPCRYFAQPAAITCNNDFEGGGWALVRRVAKGSTWFQANDNLRGTSVYGITNSRMTADSSFSILYASRVRDGTEFLIMSGTIPDF